MDWIYIVIFSLGMLILLIFISKIKIIIQYATDADTNHFRVEIKALYGLVRFEKKSELKPRPEKMAIGIKNQDRQTSPLGTEVAPKLDKINFTLVEFYNRIKDFIRIIEKTENLKDTVLDFTRKIKIKKFILKIKKGDEDAAKAAQKVGITWAVVGAEMAFIQSVFNLVECPELEVIPVFHQKIFSMEFHCISDFRVGQLIWAGLKFIFRWKGKRKFLFIPIIKEEALN